MVSNVCLSICTYEPFLDFGEEDLKLDDESEFAGQLTKIEKKAPPKNGK